MKRSTLAATIFALTLASACKKPVPPPMYEPVSVIRKDITVSAEAAGAIEPILVVDVKSRASGTILAMRAQTGDHVRRGDTLVLVDRRDPTNTLNQAEADLEVATAELTNATSAKQRADQMFQQQLVSQQEYEAAQLTFANARAKKVRAEAAVQTARDALDDTNVRAPVEGTIIAKNVEVGNVIASATRDVSGGVVLLKMANLQEVQVRTLVDETDIGKIQPGLAARVTVDAYPNQPFQGTVLKIEPQSTTNQNVTMFPVLIRIANDDERLKPGMNASVQIQVAARQNVLAIPNAALRTQRDVASAATVLGLNPADVQRQLAQADSQRGNQQQGSMAGRTPSGQEAGGRSAQAADGRQAAAPTAAPASPAPATAPSAPAAAPAGPGGAQGQRPPLPSWANQEQVDAIRAKRRNNEALTPAESTLSARLREYYQQQGFGGGRPGQGGPGGNAPATGTQAPAGGAPQTDAAQSAGASMEEIRAAFQKRQAGQTLTPHEQDILRQAAARMGQGGGRRPAANNNFMFGGNYIVFVKRNGVPTPVRVRTGVTDMDYSEVVSGLTDKDTVLLLPSQSLVQSQQDMRDRFQRMTGGGGVPGMAQQQPAAARPATTGGTPPRN